MTRGSLHTKSFRRKHLSDFRYRLIQNGSPGPKSYRGFLETGPCSYFTSFAQNNLGSRPHSSPRQALLSGVPIVPTDGEPRTGYTQKKRLMGKKAKTKDWKESKYFATWKPNTYTIRWIARRLGMPTKNASFSCNLGYWFSHHGIYGT